MLEMANIFLHFFSIPKLPHGRSEIETRFVVLFRIEQIARIGKLRLCRRRHPAKQPSLSPKLVAPSRAGPDPNA
jgi:hypothetical protein